MALKLVFLYQDKTLEEIVFDKGKNEYDLNCYSNNENKYNLILTHTTTEDKDEDLLNNNLFFDAVNRNRNKIDLIDNVLVDYQTNRGNWINVINLDIYNLKVEEIKYNNSLKRMNNLVVRPSEEIRIILKEKEEI